MVATSSPLYAAAVGAVVAGLIFSRLTGRLMAQVVTLVHELGHATVGLLVGGRVQRVSIALDASGETLTLLGGRAPRLRLTAFTLAGYPAPALAGLLAAFAVSTDDHRLFLFLGAIGVLAALLLWVRNLWGIVVFAATGVGLWFAATEGSDGVTRTVALVLAWLFTMGGLRSAWQLTRGPRTTSMGIDDAERVAQLARVLPRGVVSAGFVVVAAASLAGAGALLLLPS